MPINTGALMEPTQRQVDSWKNKNQNQNSYANWLNSSGQDFIANLPNQISTPTNLPVYQAPAVNIAPAQAPKIEMSSLPDYTGRIQEAADKAISSGLAQLQELTFKPEYTQERERIESRGLVGSGVENEVLRNLMTSQQARAGEFASGIQQKAFEQQTAELQALREMQFEKAVNEGNWEQAITIHNDEVKLDLAKINQQNEQFKSTYALDIEKFKQDSAYNNYMANLERDKFLLAAYEAETGISLDNEKLDLAEREMVGNQAAQAGYKGDDFIRFVNDATGATDSSQYRTPNEIERNRYAGETVSLGELLTSPIGTRETKETLMNAGGRTIYSGINGLGDVIALGDSAWESIADGTYTKVR